VIAMPESLPRTPAQWVGALALVLTVAIGVVGWGSLEAPTGSEAVIVSVDRLADGIATR
jgi:hypothetical protein